ncbi:MAG: S-methyl-5-thioribose-1-phosphate isomerase [Lentisphaeria bacterium]
MRDLNSLALRRSAGRLLVLDQRRLPHEECWVDCRGVDPMIELIRGLAVRGAPLIGVAAALALAQAAAAGLPPAEWRAAAARLRAARPTAVNLMAAVDRMTAAAGPSPELAGPAVAAAAETIFDEDVRLCEAVARHGAALCAPGEAVLTHCNAGALATAGIGTALGIIRRGFEQGRVAHVFVDETRPLLQGARLTAWELARAGIPHTLLCDNMAAALMAAGRVRRIVVGADRIAANGDFANKVGTYGLAVLARHHGVPFVVAAPLTTVDRGCPDGQAIPVEERAAAEVRGFAGAAGAVCWTAPATPAWNPAFDVTPAALVTALVLDCGVWRPGTDAAFPDWLKGRAHA